MAAAGKSTNRILPTFVAAGLLVALSGCLSIWFGGDIYHREGSGFSSLGRSSAEWRADWKIVADRYGYDGKEIVKALQNRGATCGNPMFLGLPQDDTTYECGYVFCRGPFYQIYTWEFPKAVFLPGVERLQYADINIQAQPACEGVREKQKLLELQRRQFCGRIRDSDCPYNVQNE